MPDLSILTANTQVEQALQTAILLGMGRRLTVADATALAAIPSAGVKHDALAFVTASGYAWRFDRYSTAAASSTVIVPADGPAAGRWIRTASTSASGYLKAANLYDGEPDEGDILEWLFGQVPSVVVVWDGDDYEPKSGGSPGALYRVPMRFSIWAISRNLRGEQQGITGSQLAGEAAADPGVYRIVGDLRRYLAGSALNQAGVNYVEILSADRVISSRTKNRGHVYRLAVKVYCTIHNTVADDADNPAHALDRIDATYLWAQGVGADGATVGESSYLSSGGGLSSAAGLTATYAAGTYTIDGVAVAFNAATRALAPSVLTFRYVNAAGAISYLEHPDDGTVPATPAGAYLIGATLANASGVEIDRLLAPALLTSGLTDQFNV